MELMEYFWNISGIFFASGSALQDQQVRRRANQWKLPLSENNENNVADWANHRSHPSGLRGQWRPADFRLPSALCFPPCVGRSERECGTDEIAPTLFSLESDHESTQVKRSLPQNPLSNWRRLLKRDYGSRKFSSHLESSPRIARGYMDTPQGVHNCSLCFFPLGGAGALSILSFHTPIVDFFIFSVAYLFPV